MGKARQERREGRGGQRQLSDQYQVFRAKKPIFKIRLMWFKFQLSPSRPVTSSVSLCTEPQLPYLENKTPLTCPARTRKPQPRAGLLLGLDKGWLCSSWG